MPSLRVEVLFVQGGGKDVHDAWDNKLVASLEQALGAGYTIHYPRMPDEADPHAQVWKKAIGRELSKLSDGVVVVGHSIGGAIVLDYLAEHDERRIAGLFLIATPFIGDGGWPSDELRRTSETIAQLPDVPIYFYQGSDDETVPIGHIEMFAKAVPHAKIRKLEHRNHQLNDDLSEVAQDVRR